MSLSTLAASHFASAQKTLARLHGLAPAESANLTLDGVPLLGVVHEEASRYEPTATGYERVRELMVSITRAQLPQRPDAARRPLVRALGADWYVVNVAEQPHHWQLTCRPA